MRLPIARARGNANRIMGTLRYYSGMATYIYGNTIENLLPGDIIFYTRKESVGDVSVIIPWNAHTDASVWKIVPALATGCTVVLKPSEEAMLTPLLIAKFMASAGAFDGVVNIAPPAPAFRLVRASPNVRASIRLF